MGNGRAEGSSATEDSGQAEISLMLRLMTWVMAPCWIHFFLPLEKLIQGCLGSTALFIATSLLLLYLLLDILGLE